MSAGAGPIAGDLATKQDLAELRTGLKQDIAVLKFAVFSFGPVIIGLPVKLVFFS